MLYLVLEWVSRQLSLNVPRNKGKLKTTEVFHGATTHKSSAGLIPLRGTHVSFLADRLHKAVQSFFLHSPQPRHKEGMGDVSHEPLDGLLVVTALNFISRETPHRSVFGLSVSNPYSGNMP